MEQNLISYIKKSHIKAVEKFNEELKGGRKRPEKSLSHSTRMLSLASPFTLADVAISQDGQLFYTYDGKVEFEVIVRKDEFTKKYYEDEGMDGIMEYVKFWRKCLNRAKKYWSMDSEKLDRLQDPENEEEDEDEEED